MKILRIPLAIVLVVVAGRAFNAEAQTETNLYSFVGFPTDGNGPEAGLVQGSDGNFYGTTDIGGTNNDGTVFRISPSGTYTNLYSFVGPPSDGYQPTAGLVQGSDGNFYGTTYEGGTSANCDGVGCGTVFRISPSGNYTQLYSFAGPPDGAQPYAGLVQGSDGNFYGTTEHGGSGSCSLGCGTVFRISPSGTETNLHSFAGSPTDGAYPSAGLVQGSDGNFYGTTQVGGTNPCQCGTVFRISSSGSYTTLYSFVGYPNDGVDPRGLVQGSDGNFYGTTQVGGTNDDGTVFRISPSGSYTSLYSFGSYPGDGGDPAGLVQGSDGNFYGTTEHGGTNNDGTVFKLTVPLSPPPYPINQITGVQLAGTNVVFNVVSIAGETYQLQYRNSLTSGSWSNVPVSVTNSIGSILTLTNFAGANQPQGFYRFAITP
jgi:uncharacterized repeat protein (TIGR03803 family)